MAFQSRDNIRNYGRFLPDCDIDTYNALIALIDNRVNRDSGLTRLAVADYKLTLTAPNRNYCINRHNSRLERHFNRLTRCNSRRERLYRARMVGYNLAALVKGYRERRDNSAEQLRTYRNFHISPGAPDYAALTNVFTVSEKNRAYVVLFKVQRHTDVAALKLKKFAAHTIFQAVHTRNSVAHLYYRTNLRKVGGKLAFSDSFSQKPADFSCVDRQITHLLLSRLPPVPTALRQGKPALT
jgi:hypothetical protein